MDLFLPSIILSYQSVFHLASEERRLVAIMFTDMVGYTSLTERSESTALELLDEHRKIIRDLVARHRGTEVKTMGDGFLVEFPSALWALRCAYEIQQSFFETNSSRPEKQRIVARIGIHVGDVIHRSGDILGDGVNVASRIEQIAEPGGICITQQVFDQVRNKFELPISSRGTRELKNVSAPVPVYQIELPWMKKTLSSSDLEKKSGSRRVAVLPFASFSPDKTDEYFADGLTEELISTISRIKDLTVIARTSVMRYKNTKKSVTEIANELNVGTLLEGSVRKAQDKLRITAQLIDAHTDGHLWSENYDREMKDIFEIQSEIAQHVASALKLNLLSEEKVIIEKRSASTQDPDVYSLYLKGLYYFNERTEDSMRKSIKYYERALAKDPKHALSLAGLAGVYSILANYEIISAKEVCAQAKAYALEALRIDNTLPEAHVFLGSALWISWDIEGAGREIKRAIDLNPNYALAHHFYSIWLRVKGRFDDALKEIELAWELDPYSPIINTAYGAYYFEKREYARAIEEMRKALEIFPDFRNLHNYLGSALVLSAKYSEGIAELEKAVLLSGNDLGMKSDLAFGLALAGRSKEAEKILEELKQSAKEVYVSPLTFAVVYSGLGRKNEALEYLYKAYEERTGNLVQSLILGAGTWDGLRADPRFVSLLEKLPK